MKKLIVVSLGMLALSGCAGISKSTMQNYLAQGDTVLAQAQSIDCQKDCSILQNYLSQFQTIWTAIKTEVGK